MPAGRQAPPPGKGMKPMDYYKNLISMGFSPWEAANAMQGNYGSPEQYAAKGQEKAAWAGLAGQIAGVGTAYGLSQLGAGAGTAGAGAGAAGAGAAGAGAGTAGAGAAGAGTVTMPSMLGGEAALGTTGTAGLSSIGSVALPVAAAVIAANNAWETGMKDIVKGKGTREDYINQGINMALGPVTFGPMPNMVSRMIGGRSIGARMTSGKSDDQLLRDDFRGQLKTTGVADENYKVTLADGSKFDIGKDGKTKYTNVDGKTTRNAWDVDFGNPLAKFAVDQIDPMIRRIYGEEAVKAGLKPEQYTGMLVNAVTSNAKTKEDVIRNMGSVFGKSEFAKQAGINLPSTEPVRPEKGKVARLSPGLYRNDSGKIVKAKTMRDALEQAYGNTSEEK